MTPQIDVTAFLNARSIGLNGQSFENISNLPGALVLQETTETQVRLVNGDDVQLNPRRQGDNSEAPKKNHRPISSAQVPRSNSRHMPRPLAK